jgi:hypothetical protein
MANNLSDYLEAQLLNLIFRTQAAWKPTAIYIGLWTATLTDASTGATAGEVSGGSYARVQVTQADAKWTAPGAPGLTDNVDPITFPTPTANWGTVTDVMIVDTASGAGNCLFYGALTAPKTINNGDPAPYFAAGAFDVTLA